MQNDLIIPDKLANKDISLTEMHSSRLPPDDGRHLHFNHPMVPHRYEVETNP